MNVGSLSIAIRSEHAVSGCVTDVVALSTFSIQPILFLKYLMLAVSAYN